MRPIFINKMNQVNVLTHFINKLNNEIILVLQRVYNACIYLVFFKNKRYLNRIYNDYKVYFCHKRVLTKNFIYLTPLINKRFN